MLLAGSRIIPAVLTAIARDDSREEFTLAVLAIAIGIASVASAQEHRGGPRSDLTSTISVVMLRIVSHAID